MESFAKHAKTIVSAVIHDFNAVRLPAQELAWGKSFIEQMQNVTSSQRSQEITKQLGPIMNNCWERELTKLIPTLKEDATNGHDWTIGENNDLALEDKNSFATSYSWLGNGFKKTPVHFLKKFKIDENGRVTHVFVAVVDLSKCKSAWSEKKTGFNGSSLQLLSEDVDNVHVIHGGFKRGSGRGAKWGELEFAPV